MKKRMPEGAIDIGTHTSVELVSLFFYRSFAADNHL
jgi:hypothetical protein